MKNKLAINDCRAGVAIKLALRAYRRLPSNETKLSDGHWKRARLEAKGF
jgi:hypothetical protein